MKMLVCGKGGSGKSTVTALLARALNLSGYRVLVMDMDESNTGLHRLLGIDAPVSVLEGLGGKPGLREKMRPAFPGGAPGGALFTPPIRTGELPDPWISEADGIRLLVIGKIHDFGEGCACPMGGLARTLLSGLEPDPEEIVIVDTAAGVEHFGRGVDGLADVILGVLDPTFASLQLAEKMDKLAAEAKTDIYYLFNKVDDTVEALMEERLATGRLIARIPYEHSLFRAGLEGTKLADDTLLSAVEPVLRLVA